MTLPSSSVFDSVPQVPSGAFRSASLSLFCPIWPTHRSLQVQLRRGSSWSGVTGSARPLLVPSCDPIRVQPTHGRMASAGLNRVPVPVVVKYVLMDRLVRDKDSGGQTREARGVPPRRRFGKADQVWPRFAGKGPGEIVFGSGRERLRDPQGIDSDRRASSRENRPVKPATWRSSSYEPLADLIHRDFKDRGIGLIADTPPF